MSSDLCGDKDLFSTHETLKIYTLWKSKRHLAFKIKWLFGYQPSADTSSFSVKKPGYSCPNLVLSEAHGSTQ